MILGTHSRLERRNGRLGLILEHCRETSVGLCWLQSRNEASFKAFHSVRDDPQRFSRHANPVGLACVQGLTIPEFPKEVW